MTVWQKLNRGLRSFRHDCGGNVMITFALVTLPLIAFTGFAVDYSHANSVKAAMQAALDSTALMLSKQASTDTSAQLQSNARNYFTAVFTRPEATNVTITATYNGTGGSQVVVNGSVNVPTQFLGVIGYQNIPVTGSSTARWGTTRLRVALVLDNTGSMADDGKMAALKTATKNLLTQLNNAATNNGDVYVSIVPFSKDVNVGTSNVNASWIDWTDWEAANGGGNGNNNNNGNNNMSGSICYNGTLYRVNGQNWTTGGSCTGLASGVCYQGSVYQWNGSNFYTTGTCNNNSNHANWNGCVTDRGNNNGPHGQNYDQNVLPATTVAGSQYPAEQYSGCPVAIKPLSYDWTGMNALVDSMQPNGYTNQPIGLVWGWLTLDGGDVFTVPALDSGYTYNKVIILMSDGLNTEDRWYVSASSIDNRMYQTGSGAGTCANIKAAGITIYTIHVNTGGDPMSTLLQNCASGPDKFWMITNASGLGTVFNQIGTNLTKLRVAR